MTVRPTKTLISLGIRPVWSESSLCAQWIAKDPSFLHADSEDSYQTGRIPRLIWVFAGRTCHFCWFCHEAAQLLSFSAKWLVNKFEIKLWTLKCLFCQNEYSEKIAKPSYNNNYKNNNWLARFSSYSCLPLIKRQLLPKVLLTTLLKGNIFKISEKNSNITTLRQWKSSIFACSKK